MLPTQYKDFIKQVENDTELSKLVKETQNKLNDSGLPEYDFYLVSYLWEKIMDKALDKNWPNHGALILDDQSNSPMPESVHKQFVNMLVKPKNINLLTDIPYYEDLLDIESITSDPEEYESNLSVKNQMWKSVNNVSATCSIVKNSFNSNPTEIQLNVGIFGNKINNPSEKILLDSCAVLYNTETEELWYPSIFKSDKVNSAILAAYKNLKKSKSK